jgi:hypothetical protein
MHVRIEADPEELREKSTDLLQALAKAFADVSPELAESLEKALPEKESILKLPVLKELHTRTAQAYQRQMQLMLKDIGKVLDRSLNKSDFYDYTKPLADRDGRAYLRVKEVLKRKGYYDSDFEEGGPLYGYSVNDLIDLARGVSSTSEAV